MKRGRLKAAAVVSSLAVLLAIGSDPASADGNAGVHLHKFVDPVQLTINPGIAASLAVDKSSAIPGDTLTYTAVVTNPTATFGMGGYIDAESVASAEATVAYYWDQLEICATGCGNGQKDRRQDPRQPIHRYRLGARRQHAPPATPDTPGGVTA